MTTKTATQISKAVQCIDPDAHTAGTINGTAIDCRQHRQALFMLILGVLGTSATVDAKIQEAVEDTFSAPIDVAGAAWTQKVEGTDDSLVFQGSVDTSKRLRYLRIVVVLAVATSDLGAAAVLSDAQKLEITPVNADVFAV